MCKNDYSHIAVREIIIQRLPAKRAETFCEVLAGHLDTDNVKLASSYGAGYKCVQMNMFNYSFNDYVE